MFSLTLNKPSKMIVKQEKILPLGQSDFPYLRKSNAVYVDKTDLICSLCSVPAKILLTRPRRFGKSLLVSTFESLFKHGLRDFKGLKIEKQWTDRLYDVVRLDFSSVKEFSSAEDFSLQLGRLLSSSFSKVGFQKQNAGQTLSELAQWMQDLDSGTLVVLIDEYDAPLTACLDDARLFEEVRSEMGRFFACLKSNSGCLRFLFITGITKFSSTTIFSELNNLTDISLDERYGALLGYTEEELKQSFSSYLTQSAQSLGLSEQELAQELQVYYDGFCFEETGCVHVYCPWSVLNFFNRPERGFQNYWFASGGHPAVLMKHLKGHRLGNPDSFNQPVALSLDALSTPRQLGEFSVEVLLAQTGYLTIRQRLSADHVLLGYPNREVCLSMGRLYADELLESRPGAECSLAYWAQILGQQSPAQVVEAFNTVFNTIDYIRYPVKDEASCRSHLQMLLIGAGLSPVTELHSALGRSDLEVDAANRRWVFELKFVKSTVSVDDALAQALEQIKSRRYGQAPGGKELICIALVFCADQRRFAAWRQASN